jgi:hypothetical protein
VLTVFAIPKAFEGECARLQRNAIRSWQRLGPDIQVILLGDDPAVADTAAEFSADHVPGVAVNQFRTPLLDSAFALAEQHARHAVLAYANADLILPLNFLTAVSTVRAATRRFMLVGRCYDLFVGEELDTRGLDDVGARTDGKMRGYEWIDYFVFPKGIMGRLPPFAVGRPWWDMWMIWRARKLRLDVVDVTEDVHVIHQRHGYGHLENSSPRWWGPEGDANRALLRIGQSLSIEDATYRLKEGRLLRDRGTLQRRVRTALFMNDWSIPIYRAMRTIYGVRRWFRQQTA